MAYELSTAQLAYYKDMMRLRKTEHKWQVLANLKRSSWMPQALVVRYRDVGRLLGPGAAADPRGTKC